MRLHWWCLAVVVACGGRGVVDDPLPAADASAQDVQDTPALVPSDVDAGVANPCPAGVARTVSLDGLWSARYQEGEQGDYLDTADQHPLGSVAVPGWLLPFDRFPALSRDGELIYERDLVWPDVWDCAPAPGAQVQVEFESADYATTVNLDEVRLDTHTGYIGSFSAPLPWGSSGRLQVRLLDSVHDVDHWGGMERFAHPTLQGADEGGWGINPLGLPGSVRLRLVGPVRLPRLYATPVAREGELTRVRVGLEAEADYDLRGAGVALDVAIIGPTGELLLSESHEATVDGSGHARLLVDAVVGLADVPVGGYEEATVEVTLRYDGVVSDVRTTPLINRRVRLVGSSLEVNEERHFARGAATYHGLRLAPFDGPYVPMTYVAVEELLARYAALLAEARAVGAQWLRPAHHVPDPAFLKAARAAGFLLYQDFPLHWNTSAGIGSAVPITEQFRDFVWRVAAEPAVAIIAIHNEAEIGETNAAELAWCRNLLTALRGVALDIAPHLVVIGCSGCGGTAVFPPDPAWVMTQEEISDRHAYFGSWWQPWDGYGDLPARVASLAEGPLPVLWSELGNGWTKHFAYLAALDDTLEPAMPPPLVALRAEIEGWLEAPNGTPLTLRQFYAALWCLRENGVPLPRLPACAAEVAPGPDAELIAFAKAHFLGDRPTVEGDPKDPATQGAVVAAHWLASQVFEARWQWAQGAGFLGVLSWERPENGYPFSTPAPERVPAAAVERSRAIVAAANAPVAAALRMVGRQVEARVVNDEAPRTLILRLLAGDDVVWTQEVPVGRGAGVAALVGPSLLVGRAGQLLRLEVTDGAAVATAAMVCAP